MTKINFKAIDNDICSGNGLTAYVRLGELIEMDLVIELTDIRHGIVEVELTEKGQAVLAQAPSELDTDTPDSHRHLRDDSDLMGLLKLCQTGNLGQTQGIVRGNP